MTYTPRSPDLRGSNKDRRARKMYLLAGRRTVPCVYCGRRLNYRALTVDRIRPGAFGGRYTRDNIQPACSRCQTQTGNALKAQIARGDNPCP